MMFTLPHIAHIFGVDRTALLYEWVKLYAMPQIFGCVNFEPEETPCNDANS